MSKVLEAALAHYRANETKSVLVPEWKVDAKPVRVFWRLLTPQERDDLTVAGEIQDVDVVVKKALDKDGKRLFADGDELKLKMASSNKLMRRLAALMLDVTEVTQQGVEDAKGN
jgi:hypothetical protein